MKFVADRLVNYTQKNVISGAPLSDLKERVWCNVGRDYKYPDVDYKKKTLYLFADSTLWLGKGEKPQEIFLNDHIKPALKSLVANVEMVSLENGATAGSLLEELEKVVMKDPAAKGVPSNSRGLR